MGFAELCKEKALLSKISQANKSGHPLSSELYQEMRDYETKWLEDHYDFNSVEGINAIPVQNPRRPPTTGITGEVYYYLRKKGYDYENANETELAIACLRKSVAILRHSKYFSKDEAYPLVKVLARAGYIDEAYREKAWIDEAVNKMVAQEASTFAQFRIRAKALRTDLVIMDAHANTCPACAIFQGRVFSLSGQSRTFPKIPDFLLSNGSVHEGCSHMLWAYIEGVSDPQLEYTLEVHPLKNKQFGRSIVSFSNRPFVDDRTEECKNAAACARKKELEEQTKEQYYENHMVEIEAERGKEARDFRWLQDIIPQKCPKSLSGYRRMKTQNTKNYQLLKQLAGEKGREI